MGQEKTGCFQKIKVQLSFFKRKNGIKGFARLLTKKSIKHKEKGNKNIHTLTLFHKIKTI